MSWQVDVEFRKSPTHGTGVFARRDIAAGERVWQFDPTMQVCDARTLGNLSPADLRYALLAGYLHKPSGQFLWYHDGMQFMNHALTPDANVGLWTWPKRLEDDHSVALRDIAAGEELSEDYTFCLEGGLAPDHWMRSLYLAHCPEHYAFLLGLHEFEIAA